MGYLCANFGLPRPLCSRLRPDVRDRQTDVGQHHRLMSRLLGAGHNKKVDNRDVSLPVITWDALLEDEANN